MADQITQMLVMTKHVAVLYQPQLHSQRLAQYLVANVQACARAMILLLMEVVVHIMQMLVTTILAVDHILRLDRLWVANVQVYALAKTSLRMEVVDTQMQIQDLTRVAVDLHQHLRRAHRMEQYLEQNAQVYLKYPTL